MLTTLAFATVLQIAAGGASPQGMERTARGMAESYRVQRSGSQGNENIRRNGRRYGSVGIPTANAIVDGRQISGGVVVVNDRVFVEMLPVFERLGVRTTYRRGDKKIEAFTRDRGVSFTIGDTWARLPERTKLDAAPMMMGEKVYIPLRAISQAFRADVRWDKGRRTAYITSSPKTKRNGANGADSVGGLGAGSGSRSAGSGSGTGGGVTGGGTGLTGGGTGG